MGNPDGSAAPYGVRQFGIAGDVGSSCDSRSNQDSSSDKELDCLETQFLTPSGSRPLDSESFFRSSSDSSWPVPTTDDDSGIAVVMKLPLGLSLRKSESLIDLIMLNNSSEASLSPKSGSESSAGSHPFKSSASYAQSQNSGSTAHLVSSKGPNSCGDSSASSSTSEADMKKLKASNFPVMHLRVGDWEYHSRYVGDLVSKCYFAKRKLVWEILNNGLKSKIEMQWSDICGLKASFPENENATLEVRLSRPPLFFRETNPQPRKHTLWQATADFTGSEATLCKPHYLMVTPGLMNKHFDKLLACDARLRALVKSPCPLPPRSITPVAFAAPVPHSAHAERPPKRARRVADSGADTWEGTDTLAVPCMLDLCGTPAVDPVVEIFPVDAAPVMDTSMEDFDTSVLAVDSQLSPFVRSNSLQSTNDKNRLSKLYHILDMKLGNMGGLASYRASATTNAQLMELMAPRGVVYQDPLLVQQG
eukprot:CAMPEP_0118933854 /NCGR_PEP_ID=MMETSP1169-20130426/12719_1 /TAXON_ID=36882 /ORGANISM="Pyramimonas obovata, Strain CCMP722" /LENGTH=476 /DNA_ID=CAMNT_0006876673 /DNA_START=154 /DNA_END=1584 /DNA_ORIENTATION=+